jgi:hypothetical protein
MEAITHEGRGAVRLPRLAGFTRPAAVLRVEGTALLAISVLLYWVSGGSWLTFALLLLARDHSMLGYIGGARVGAAVNNVFHAPWLVGVLRGPGLFSRSAAVLHPGAVSAMCCRELGVSRTQ